jgi:K+-transporting ATPase A subunit
MNFHQYHVVTTVEGAKQIIPQGPVAARDVRLMPLAHGRPN